MRFLAAFALSTLLAAPCFAGPEDAAKAYTLDVPTKPIVVKKGQQGTARIAIVPREDAHVSPDAPLSVSLTAGQSVELPKAKLARADSKETAQKGAEFAIPFTGKASGKDEIKASMTFFICTATLCERQKKDVVVPVQVD